jgi:hypothetical protein
MDKKQIGRLRDYRDRRQILERVVVELLVKAGTAGKPEPTDRDGVAIRWCLCPNFASYVTAGAGTVVSHHRLAEALAKSLPYEAAQKIGWPARRIG